MEESIQTLAIRIPVILFAVSIHECAHAWMADRCGDSTARYQGRITLNPTAHFDMVGLLCMVLTQFRFGWGRPVPVNPYNLRNLRRDDMLVSFAGPASNFLMALVCGIIFRICVVAFPGIAGMNAPPEGGSVLPWFLSSLALQGVVIASMLGVFNLIPVYPLDGSHILKGFLPTEMAIKYESMNVYAPLLLMIVLVAVWRTGILQPFVLFFVWLFAGIG